MKPVIVNHPERFPFSACSSIQLHRPEEGDGTQRAPKGNVSNLITNNNGYGYLFLLVTPATEQNKFCFPDANVEGEFRELIRIPSWHKNDFWISWISMMVIPAHMIINSSRRPA
jgi:hypothetical protein